MDQNNYNKGQDPLYEQVMRSSGSTVQQGTVGGRRTFGARGAMGNMADAVMSEVGLISRRAYNAIIGLIVLWGVGIDTAICYFYGDQLTQTFQNRWAWVLLYLALVIGGMIIVNVAKNAVLCFLGYNLMVVGFGVTLAMVVGMYMPAVVFEAFLVTAIVTGLMLLLGTLWQDFFKRIGVVLVVGLIAVIIIEVVMLLFTGTYPTWVSVVSAILFSGFIGYDWAKAQEAPPTAKNAVMFATSLFVDIINLFLDILRIVGRSD